jgi:Flp pilus assembly protein TadG
MRRIYLPGLRNCRRTVAFWRDCRGGAAAELALVLPVLAYVALNVTDLSVYIYSKMQVELAAQEAVGAARSSCNTAALLPVTQNCTGYANTMLTAAQTTSLGTAVTLPSTSEKYYCATSSGTFNATYTYNLGSQPANCSTAIAGSTAPPGDYIQATASYPFASLFPGATVASALPSPITRTAWMRVQ